MGFPRPMSASKLATCIVAASLLLLANPASASATVTVEITLNGAAYKSCPVALPAGADGGHALDAAVSTGCLLEWSHDSFDGYGRYVTSIDFVPSAVATFWALYVDGAFSDIGIDGLELRGGEVLRLDYQQWVVAL